MPVRQRDTGLDVFKAILVIGMIYAHVLDIWRLSFMGSDFTSAVLNVVSFSGFLFCFGYAAQIAYFSEERLNYRRIFATIYRPLLAFYLVGLYIEVFLLQQLPALSDIVSVLLLSRLPLDSEFLPAFSLTLLASVVLLKPLRWILESRRRVLIACFLLLLTTFFPYQIIRMPQLGLLVGTTQDVSLTFPVLQYFIFFLLGLYFGRNTLLDIPLVVKIMGLVGIAAFCVLVLKMQAPERFPPSLGWILGGLAFVMIEYVVARFLDKWALVRRWLVPIGENTLIYLVISNMMLFGIRRIVLSQVNFVVSLLCTAFVVVGIYYLLSITRRIKTV
jgi:hypothetical protein